MKEVRLNEGQAKAEKLIKAWLEDEKESEFLLIGPAGSGKTFLLEHALSDWKGMKNLIAGATISHAAKDVLRKSIGNLAECYTVLQLLGMRPDFGSKGKSYKPINSKKEPPIIGAKLIIVDECSMIDQEMTDLIREMVPVGSKILFMGDDKQLPPVSDDDVASPTFQVRNRAELTESQRFKGAIGDVAQFYRNYIEYAIQAGNRTDPTNLYVYMPQVTGEDSSVYFMNDREVFEQYITAYIKTYPNDTRILCYRNDLINSYNERMRAMMMGESIDTIAVGEKVVLNKPYKSIGSVPHYFHNGEIIQIESIDYNYKKVSFYNDTQVEDYESGLSHAMYKVYELSVTVDGHKKLLHHIHPQSYREYFRVLNSLEKVAKETNNKVAWINYRRFEESFVNFSYLYAQSSHKAQGQSIDHVFVFADDILNTGVSWATKLKSLYVAATRAKKTLFVYMKPEEQEDE